MIISLGGLTFNDDIPDANGAHWYVTALDGWDSPPLRTDQADPSSRHGSVLTKALLAARAMVLTGVVKSPSLAAHYASVDTFQGQTNNLVVPKPFRVTENVVKECGVIRAGQARISLLGQCAFEFEIPLTAMDPLKYAVNPLNVMVNAGASVTATLPGTFVTERIYLYPSNTGHVKIANTTVSYLPLRTDTEVTAGTEFSVLNRTVTDTSGANVYGALAPSSLWWGLQPGANVLNNAGPSAVSVFYYPAWL